MEGEEDVTGAIHAFHRPPPVSDSPVAANYSHDKIVTGAGVAIFHLASSRVVVCYHTGDRYWFLPKGRRDVHETTEEGAEREGFEESGYRNRLLPIPIRHRQPRPRIPSERNSSPFVTEPIWTQMMPQSRTAQYLLFWYIAETLPPVMESVLNAAERAASGAYQYPSKYPAGLKLKERIKLDPDGYTPVKHEGTAADEEEALYESYLLTVGEARRKLMSRVERDVVKQGWEAIQLRLQLEEEGA